MELQYDIWPVQPVAPYIGGKRNLAKRVVARIEAVPHDGYAEPFVGMAGVFFRRRRAPKVEVINDYNQEVATLFRVLQRHYVPFLDMLRFQLTTRREFERLQVTDPGTLTDLERAARFLYLQRTGFGGKVDGRTFGLSNDRPARFDVAKLAPMLEDVHERLSGVVIECLDFREFLRRYDRAGMLFYLDPPYWGSESDYGEGMFRRQDFQELAAALRGLKGRFLLSINDRPELRDIFDGLTMESVETTYTVAKEGGGKAAPELLISGP
ncbi:DNA adenine methylase [Ferruginivarius sediminum]|uniref:site-specific DNA-methyltransferase (adenine-specific) n=1 Tax=Ferruginivarius sediminum TaxID=2661937 RepID=A0A369T779_9PROT|nr:DNA adenine methylase [Ferruginivarius sediminum]RDD60215.1 DNA adenine methylase [Ferruginivarius sediminum]